VCSSDLIGVIQLINSLDEHGNPVPYDTWMEELVSSLASQAAVAITNSVLISDIKKVFESLVTYSAQAIDARSPHTAGHSLRVSELVMRMAEVINGMTDGPFAGATFSEEEMTELRMAAWFHDIGKIGVRENVLDKVNKLSDDQMRVISSRFAYLGKAAENRGNERKLRLCGEGGVTGGAFECIDAETGEEIAELDRALAHIRKMNRPAYAADEDIIALKGIAERCYIDGDGTEKPFLDPLEYESLLVRKGNLTEKERAEIQSHVRHTLAILEKIPFTEELADIPRFAAAHHEMLDGSGYPEKLRAEAIPFQSRIIAVADIFEALTAKDRPYKPPLPLEKAIGILRSEAEAGRLDRDLVAMFIEKEVYQAIAQ
jgi:HD-GYP domain-containing protein (c-di-GMP phosphodiesterase class II)